ncbi:glucosyltransferase domain-containing protein [Microvirga calopogonii]|uniref:glucosyltransferase domain-containing protein n=1 Tax=Microvirga calopogonii TaxID=2078013 RepID=UPI0013B3582A|nr:glucosyltransferase domain-containing protein [Microvirga calopogonii]
MRKGAFALQMMWAKYSGPILLAFILGVLARGQALFAPLYSIDTYSAAYNKGPEATYSFLLSQGRFGLAAIWWLRDVLGVYGIEAASASLGIAIFLLVVAGLLFVLALLERPTPLEVLVFASIFTLHPFNTEFFYFADATFNISLAIFLSSIGIAAATLLQTRWKAIFWGATFTAFALSIYQSAVAHVGTIWLLATIARLIYDTGNRLTLKANLAHSIRSLVSIAIGLALYLACLGIIKRVTGINLDARTDFSQLTRVNEKLQALGSALRWALYPDSGLISLSTSTLLIGLLISGTLIIIFPLLHRGKFVKTVVCLGLLSGGLLWSSGASLVGGVIWLVPRVLSPISVFAAGVLAIAWHGSSKQIRGALAAATGILCISYIGASNHILFDQRRLNLWDAQEANRIVARLEQRTDFRNITSLALVGGNWRRASALSTTIGDMNTSALAVAWAKIGLIEQTTGYRFAEPTTAEWITARDHCAGTLTWPAEESINVIGTLGIVCLTKPPS